MRHGELRRHECAVHQQRQLLQRLFVLEREPLVPTGKLRVSGRDLYQHRELLQRLELLQRAVQLDLQSHRLPMHEQRRMLRPESVYEWDLLALE
jgi:hypothetical protein